MMMMLAIGGVLFVALCANMALWYRYLCLTRAEKFGNIGLRQYKDIDGYVTIGAREMKRYRKNRGRMNDRFDLCLCVAYAKEVCDKCGVDFPTFFRALLETNTLDMLKLADEIEASWKTKRYYVRDSKIYEKRHERFVPDEKDRL